jgi:putative endonuclease
VVSRDSFNVWIAVYMMASRKHGVIYTGVTSKLPGRAYQHRERLLQGFTAKYGAHRLVWFETHETIVSAIQREKNIKKYKREWKINLIEASNPDWYDLYPTLLGVTDHERWPEVERIKPK